MNATCAHHGERCEFEVGHDGIHLYPQRKRPAGRRPSHPTPSADFQETEEEYLAIVPRDNRQEKDPQ